MLGITPALIMPLPQGSWAAWQLHRIDYYLHYLSITSDGMRCVDGLTKALTSLLSPHHQGSDEAEEQELVRLAASANGAIRKLPEYRLALQELTHRSVQGVACDTSQSLLHEKDAVKSAEAGQFLLAARQFTRSLGYVDEIQHPQRASICLTNRALCLLQLQQHSNAAEDCLAALKVYESFARAHFLCALALQQLQQYTAAEGHACGAAAAATAAHLPSSAAHDAARLLADIQKSASSTATKSQSQAPASDANRSEPCLTLPLLEVRDTASEGRTLCMGGCEGAKAGDLLMREEACTAIVMRQHRKAVRSNPYTCVPFLPPTTSRTA